MTRTLTGHIIEVPAHLIPCMFDDWGLADIHDVGPDGTVSNIHVNGYDMTDDGDISRIRWITANLRDLPDDVTPDTMLNVWVPRIPEALAAELA